MRDFLLDENGDIVLENGVFVCIEDEQTQLRQKIRMMLGSVRGEWFLNVEEGFEQKLVLAKNPSEEALRDEIGRVLLFLFDTVQFSSFTIEREKRNLTIRFELAGLSEVLSWEQTF